MSKTKQLAESIHNRVSSGEMTVNDIEFLIQHHFDDATKVLKNINKTSLNDNDRFSRIVDFEQTFGLSKTHLV